MTITQQRTAPTTKQLDFIQTLLSHRDPDNAAEDFLAFMEGVETGDVSRRDATAYIGSLIAAQRARITEGSGSQHITQIGVPAGRYALPRDEDTNLYQIDRPTQGRWDGWTFVNLIHADGTRIRSVKGGERGRVIALIAQDPTAASRAYGKHTGTCGVCARTLTNPESVALGIGPVCASRL